MQKSFFIAAAVTLLCASSFSMAAHHEKAKDNNATAKGWFMASCGDLDGFVKYVKKHMANDGVVMPPRYVGLGFILDNYEGENFGTVMMVMPGTPAAGVLKAGDKFVSVNGVDMTFENRDDMTFRGAPGKPVKAMIERDGKTMPIMVTRGVIERASTKEQVLERLSKANAEDWPATSCIVTEVVSEGNVVFLVGERNDMEMSTGYPYTTRSVGRMEFNEAGKVVKAWYMDESQFVLEQLGYTISR